MFKHYASDTYLQSTSQKRQESFSQATADILLAQACTRNTVNKRLTFSNSLYSDFHVQFSTQ